MKKLENRSVTIKSALNERPAERTGTKSQKRDELMKEKASEGENDQKGDV